MDFLGKLDSALLAGFGFGQVAKVPILPGQPISAEHYEVAWHPDQNTLTTWRNKQVQLGNMLVLLDGSENAAKAIPLAELIAQKLASKITVASFIKQRSDEQYQKDVEEIRAYLDEIVNRLQKDGFQSHAIVEPGSITDQTEAGELVHEFDLVVTTTQGESGVKNWFQGGFSHKLVQNLDKPVLLVQVDEDGNGITTKIDSILVALDGSSYSERVLPYARALAKVFKSKLVLLSVPAVPDASEYRAAADVIEKIRGKAEARIRKYLDNTASILRKDGLKVKVRVSGSIPSHEIVSIAAEENINLIMLSSQGRGGYNAVLMGSVTDYVVNNTHLPAFIVPIHDDGNGNGTSLRVSNGG